MKAGAASVAVNSGVDYNSIDKHAGWRCKESKFRYASDSLDRKLIVSKSIGLKNDLLTFFVTFPPRFVLSRVTVSTKAPLHQ